ncbi:hypothetical protein L3X38_002434 [Prunus dulcis]|uniref:Uncharacterized protein n=1 Tax=Prunus dulcis TaxID=3755 RepID=A0AAD4WXI2_PRUDU|nr:hypothetical protein L3X38_002434 [Prunus dulcis]
MSKRDKDVPANKKLHMPIHSVVQDYLQGDISTQPEVQRNINLELIKKNIKDDESDFAHRPPFSIQEKESEYDAYRVIDDVCCMLSRTRSSLRVIYDSTCKVIGSFTFACYDTPHDGSSSPEEIPSCHRIICTSFSNWEASFILG